MFFNVFVLHNVYALAFKMSEESIIIRLLLSVFASVIAGVFLGALYAPAQPIVTASIAILLQLSLFKLSRSQRAIMIGTNILLAFLPPLIRVSAGI